MVDADCRVTYVLGDSRIVLDCAPRNQLHAVQVVEGRSRQDAACDLKSVDQRSQVVRVVEVVGIDQRRCSRIRRGQCHRPAALRAHRDRDDAVAMPDRNRRARRIAQQRHEDDLQVRPLVLRARAHEPRRFEHVARKRPLTPEQILQDIPRTARKGFDRHSV